MKVRRRGKKANHEDKVGIEPDLIEGRKNIVEESRPPQINQSVGDWELSTTFIAKRTPENPTAYSL